MEERRRETRHRALRSGKIIFNDRRSVIDCLVRNLSDDGTCLQVNSTVGIPTTFELSIEGEGTLHPCKSVWVSDNRIGVEFSESNSESVPDQGAPVRGELIALRAALDEVPIGIVLLDPGSRAQFINRAFRKMWRLSDEKADTKPPLIALMYHGRDTRAYAVPSGDLDAYIARRVAHIKAGDPKPLDLRLASGEIIRLQCTVLPNQGRMLCYTYVTDIVGRADELGNLRAALDNIQQGVILLDPMLNAQLMNRAVRSLWKVPDEQANRCPPYVELVSDARKTGTFKVPAEELGKFIANRVAVVRAGDPMPIDIPHGDGRIIRSQCAVLPNGGRMLTYTDITDLIHRADQLQELASIDGLTGLYNRRHFNVLANAEWGRFQRYHRPLSMIVLDIDCFKQINDRYGHDVGDRAIAHVAMLCREERRESDIVARIGGDEFCFVLPETDLARTQVVAERLIDKISRSELRTGQRQESIAITVSIGIAEATVSMSGFGALMRIADQALYQAKLNGRNRICIAEHSGALDLDTAAE